MNRDGAGEELVTLTEAARRLGVHYMTAYRYVRLGRLPASQRRGRWLVPEDALGALERPGARGSAHSWQRRRRGLDARLVAGDAGGAWAVVEQAMAQGATPLAVYLDLLAPVLKGIGERWAAGQATVEQEHRATAAALRVLGRLSPCFGHPGRPRMGTVILGGAPGDPHVVPVAMVADVVRAEGFRVVDLGANVPKASFLKAAEAEDELLAVGVSLSANGAWVSAADVLTALRRVRPQAALLVGGPAVADAGRATSLGADAWAPDAARAASLLEELWARRRSR